MITTGGAGRRAIELAFAERYGSSDLFAGFSFAGMTDYAIVREGFRRLGCDSERENLTALMGAYVTLLRAELSATSEHRLHTGMREAVALLRTREHTAVGLGTGNIERGAEAKLAPLGAYAWFAFGGFGSDHEQREELIRIGLERGKERLGSQDARGVIVGDTPKDIEAAHRNGALALCVATGSYDARALHAAGADHVFENLAEPDALTFLRSL